LYRCVVWIYTLQIPLDIYTAYPSTQCLTAFLPTNTSLPASTPSVAQHRTYPHPHPHICTLTLIYKDPITNHISPHPSKSSSTRATVASTNVSAPITRLGPSHITRKYKPSQKPPPPPFFFLRLELLWCLVAMSLAPLLCNVTLFLSSVSPTIPSLISLCHFLAITNII
jgi:hypothetical protein